MIKILFRVDINQIFECAEYVFLLTVDVDIFSYRKIPIKLHNLKIIFFVYYELYCNSVRPK